MFTVEQILVGFTANYEAMVRDTAGLTHEDSLRQPPCRENCLNWVLGHVVASRSNVLRSLGAAPLLPDEEAAHYRPGSAPVTGEGPGVVRFERLLEYLQASQARIAEALRQATPEVLGREAEIGGRRMTVAGAVLYRLRHDAYHAGQVEYLRALIKDSGTA